MGSSIPPCSVTGSSLDPAGFFEQEKETFGREAKRLKQFLGYHPNFPFADCLRIQRATRLSAMSRFAEAEAEFEELRRSSPDPFIRERASFALNVIKELKGAAQ